MNVNNRLFNPIKLLQFSSDKGASSLLPKARRMISKDTFESSEEIYKLPMSGFQHKNVKIARFINSLFNRYIKCFEDINLLPSRVQLYKLNNKKIQAGILEIDKSLIINNYFIKDLDNIIKENVSWLDSSQLLKYDRYGKISFAFMNNLKEMQPVKKLLNKYQKVKRNMNVMHKWELADGLNSIINKISYIAETQNYEELKHINIQTPKKTILHELGHIHHNNVCKFMNELSGDDFYDVIPKLSQEFSQSKVKQKIAGSVSEYAKKSPAEFVAEVYSYCLSGEKYPKKVMDLYKYYGGPEISNCLVP